MFSLPCKRLSFIIVGVAASMRGMSLFHLLGRPMIVVARLSNNRLAPRVAVPTVPTVRAITENFVFASHWAGPLFLLGSGGFVTIHLCGV
jgi:hypothetical protein